MVWVWLIVLVVLYGLYCFLQKKSKESVALVGCAGSGKSYLFHLLRDGKVLETVTSMKKKECLLQDRILLLDIPSHLPLNESLSRIVFMVHGKNVLDSASKLFQVLKTTKVPLLIVCNSKENDVEYYRNQLEMELSRFVATDEDGTVGRIGSSFSFTIDCPCPVSFVHESFSTQTVPDSIVTFIMNTSF